MLFHSFLFLFFIHLFFLWNVSSSNPKITDMLFIVKLSMSFSSASFSLVTFSPYVMIDRITAFQIRSLVLIVYFLFLKKGFLILLYAPLANFNRCCTGVFLPVFISIWLPSNLSSFFIFTSLNGYFKSATRCFSSLLSEFFLVIFSFFFRDHYYFFPGVLKIPAF